MFLLFTRQPRPTPPRRLSRIPQPEGSEDDGLAPCGWFESSHDLRRGLLATELPPGHALPLALQLEICFAA